MCWRDAKSKHVVFVVYSICVRSSAIAIRRIDPGSPGKKDAIQTYAKLDQTSPRQHTRMRRWISMKKVCRWADACVRVIDVGVNVVLSIVSFP
jgi:hypothetical protein